jgi:hypothetical protein
MAKRLIDALVDESSSTVKEVLEGVEQIFFISHNELEQWIGANGKKIMKRHVKAISGDNSVQAYLPTFRREFDVEFNIDTSNPRTRFASLPEFNPLPRVADTLLSGFFDKTANFYRTDSVILHGYRLVRGVSSIPGINTALAWNVHSMVGEQIQTLSSAKMFFEKNIECSAYATLKDIPNDLLMGFVVPNEVNERFRPNLVAKPGTFHHHPTAKCFAMVRADTIENGVVFLELPSPHDKDKSVSVAVMHASHIIALYATINAVEHEVWVRFLPGAKKGSQNEDRCLVAMTEEVFRKLVPEVLERFVNKAPTFDPSKMVFKLSQLNRPHKFEETLEALQPQTFFSKWTVELEYSLIPKHAGMHTVSHPDLFTKDRVLNGSQLEAFLKRKTESLVDSKRAAEHRDSLKDFKRE